MDWLHTVTELTNPMNARQAIEDAEVLEALDFDPCESAHEDRTNRVCSGGGEYKQTADCQPGWSINVCANHRRYIELVWSQQGLCYDCHRTTAECWHIVHRSRRA